MFYNIEFIIRYFYVLGRLQGTKTQILRIWNNRKHPISLNSKVYVLPVFVLNYPFGSAATTSLNLQAFSEPLPRKVAFIRGKLHAERDILNAYIVYTCKEAVTKALSMNAQVFLGKHLCVDSVANPRVR